MDTRFQGWLLLALGVPVAALLCGCQPAARAGLACQLKLSTCDSRELDAYRATFARDRNNVLAAARTWSGCQPDAVACRQALNRMEVATTGLGELSTTRAPGCVDDAIRYLGIAITELRRATSVGFGASDRDQPIPVADVNEHFLRATQQLDQASAALARAHC